MQNLIDGCHSACDMFAALWRAGRHDILHDMPRIDRDEFSAGEFAAAVRYRLGLLSLLSNRPFSFGASGTLYLDDEAFPVIEGRYLPPEQGYPIGFWYVVIQFKGNYFVLGMSNRDKVAAAIWAGTSLDHAKLILSTAASWNDNYEDFHRWCRRPSSNSYALREEE